MKSKFFFFQIFLWFLPIVSPAQQIELNGQISIHNSQYRTGTIQYVDNAQVTADFAKPAVSDNDGYFTLEFVTIESGTSVDLKIEKSGLELVNRRELQDVVLGRRTPLRIYLAPKGLVAKAQAELYNVSIKALTAKHESLIALLRQKGTESKAVILDLEQKLNRTISDSFEAEQLLNEQFVATKNRLPEFAKELAAVNLDFASNMYREAYEYFKKGDIEKAIETLDEAVLDRQAEEATERLKDIKYSIADLDSAKMNEQQALVNSIESLMLKAKSYFVQSRYDSAIVDYEKILPFLDISKDEDLSRIALIYWELSEVYVKKKMPLEVLEYREKHLSIISKVEGIDNKRMIDCYKDLGSLYWAQGQMSKSVLYRRKAYEGLKGIVSIDDTDLMDAKTELLLTLEIYGESLQQQSRMIEAIDVYKEMIQIQPDNKIIKRLLKKLKRKSNKS